MAAAGLSRTAVCDLVCFLIFMNSYAQKIHLSCWNPQVLIVWAVEAFACVGSVKRYFSPSQRALYLYKLLILLFIFVSIKADEHN